MMDVKSRCRWILVILMVAAAPLFLLNLDASMLWQDEAQTALVSRTVLDRGVPYGTDGLNFFSQELGAEYGENHVWVWHTWLQFYTVAASFALLGDTTFAARLPFALFGLATVWAVAMFVRGLLRDSWAALAAAALVATCVPFLLLARQCRYYTATALFTVLALLCYVRVVRGQRGGVAGFAVTSWLLFQTHYVYVGALFGTVILHALLFHRSALRRVALSVGVALLCMSPWIIWLSGLRYGERYAERMFSWSHAIPNFAEYGRQLHVYVLPAWVLAAPVIVFLAARVRSLPAPSGNSATGRERVVALLLPVLFCVLTVASLALVVPEPFFRYLAPVIPLAMVVGGALVASLARLHPAVPVVALVLLLARQPVRDFAHELTHEYVGPIGAIVRYLQQEGRPGDVVAAPYGDMPVKFYTDLRVVGSLTGEDVQDAANARFVLSRRHIVSSHEMPLRRFLEDTLYSRDYRAVQLDAPDLPFENREDPRVHRYRTVEDEPRVTILRRVSPP